MTAPIIPLIAETGGINAMIVDSTALPEQVVQDVVTSAFRSAGQRCSALRLLRAAGGYRRADAGDAEGRDGQLDRRRSGRSAHRCRPGDRPAGLRQTDGPSRGDEGPRGSRRSPVPAEGLFVPPTLIRHRRDRGSDSRNGSGRCSTSPPGRAGKLAETVAAGQRLGLRPHHGPAQPHRPRRRDGRGDGARSAISTSTAR